MEENQNQEQEQEKVDVQKDDMLKNLKAEMDRKLSNQTTQLDELKDMLQKQADVAAQADVKHKPSEPASAENLDDLLYSNPAEYTRRLKDEMRGEWQSQQTQKDQANARQQQVLTQLVTEFPELSNASDSLTKKAVELYNKMDDQEKSYTNSYKTAVYSAAMELGVVPSSKREASDDFVLGSKGEKRSHEAELNPLTVEFAKQLGINVDEKVKERLKKYSKRNFGRYE